MATPTFPTAAPLKKKLIRRTAPDRSQRIRQLIQGLFVALNLGLGLQFFLWVRSFEHPGSLQVARPAGVDGWLPIAGLMNFKYFLSTGHIPSIHPAAMFLFMAFLLMSLVLKKAFCGWLCPVGTLSEVLWKLGKKLFRRNFRLPNWLDIPLRGLKYLLLAFFLFIIGSMSAEALSDFMQAPYALVADVKMLNFFRNLSLTAAIVIAVLFLLSFLIQNFWCRYLCPYGALMGLASLLSPLKIRRDSEACIDCGKCAQACPSHLPVDQPGADPLRRVHRLHGLCRRLLRAERSATRPAPLAKHSARRPLDPPRRLAPRRRRPAGLHLLRSYRLRQGQRTLANQPAPRRLPRPRPLRQPALPPRLLSAVNPPISASRIFLSLNGLRFKEMGFTACGKTHSGGRPGIYPRHKANRIKGGLQPLREFFRESHWKAGHFPQPAWPLPHSLRLFT